MQLRDWQVYWRGYVVIFVEGKAPEKFINLALVQGIRLWDIVPLGEQGFMAKVAIEQVKSLRPVARITKTRFRIRQKRGLPFTLRRARSRKPFIAGGIAFVVLLYYLSAMIWFVDWSSPEELQKLDPQEMLQLADDLGLRPGVWKSSLDLKEIERMLEVQLPYLAWAGIEIQGTRATIRVVEKKLPSEEQLDRKPGHLVATKDGVIDEVLVIDGQPLAKIGDTVTEGQVLVSGIISASLSEEGGDIQPGRLPRLVRARGIVRARVWYEGYAEVPLVEIGERFTGKKVTAIRLQIIDKQVILRGPGVPSFPYYLAKEKRYKPVSWRNWQVPVELIMITYHQVEPYRRVLEQKEAQKVVLEKALREIKKQLPPDIKVVYQREVMEEAPDGVVRMKVIIEAIEEITRFQPLT